MTPQALFHLVRCRPSGYHWPPSETNAVDEPWWHRGREGWSNVINPLHSEIQVVVLVEPRVHHMGGDLVRVDLPSLSLHDSLPKGGCPSSRHALTSCGGQVDYTWRHQAEPPRQPAQDPWQENSFQRLVHG